MLEIVSKFSIMCIACLSGITAHRDSDKLKLAVDRIDNISSRLDDSGFPQDYSYDELRHIMVDEKKYRLEEFQRVLEKYLETSGKWRQHFRN